jgi:hypothetical protein
VFARRRARNARRDVAPVRASFAILALFPSRDVALDASDAAWLRLPPLRAARENAVHRVAPETKFKIKSLINSVLQRRSDSIGNRFYRSPRTTACVLLSMGARRLGAAYADQRPGHRPHTD